MGVQARWRSGVVTGLLTVLLLSFGARAAHAGADPKKADQNGYYPAVVTEGPEYEAVFEINPTNGEVHADWTVPSPDPIVIPTYNPNPIPNPINTANPIVPVPCPTNRSPLPGVPQGPIFGPIIPYTIIPTPIPTPIATGVVPTPVPTSTSPVCTPIVPTNPIGIGNLPPVINPSGPLGSIQQGVVIIGQIVNIGQQIWSFIQNGHAVVTIDTQSANALPVGVTGPMQLAGWRVKSKVYNVQIPNQDPGKNIDFSFNLNFEYGGSYQGKGKFLSNVTTTVGNAHTNWGTNFTVRVRVPNDGIVNVGQTTDDPIAGAEVYVEWTRGKVFSTVNQAAVIFVRGDGQIQNLSQGDGEQDPPENLNPIGHIVD